MKPDVTEHPSVARSPRGAPPERREVFTTVSGRPIKRLYAEADVAGIDYAREIGDPGTFPYTRGIHASG
jgi:methylmalonyl-CoA mutase, N-terminal domain